MYSDKGFPDGSVVKTPPEMQGTQDIWVPSLRREDPLKKEMATPSGILAWKIPRTEEPGELQSMGSQRAGHGREIEHTPAQDFNRAFGKGPMER